MLIHKFLIAPSHVPTAPEMFFFRYCISYILFLVLLYQTLARQLAAFLTYLFYDLQIPLIRDLCTISPARLQVQ